MPEPKPAPSMELDVPGPLGALLRGIVRARLVLTREDGAPLTPYDREAIEDVLAAVAEHETKAPTEAELRDLVMLRRIARGDARAAKKPGSGKATAAKRGKARAAKPSSKRSPKRTTRAV